MAGCLYFLVSGCADEGAGNLLGCFLGSYSSHLLFRRVPDNPNVWTGGGLVLDEVSGASSAGSSMYAHVPVIHGGIVSGSTWFWSSRLVEM